MVGEVICESGESNGGVVIGLAEGGSAMGRVTDSGRVGHGRLGFLPVGRASGARAFEWG